MSLFSKQPVYCQACGNKFEITLANGKYDGRVCSEKCWDELSWRKILSLLGKEYYPKPDPNCTSPHK